MQVLLEMHVKAHKVSAAYLLNLADDNVSCSHPVTLDDDDADDDDDDDERINF